ncbi:Mycosubtilin synthase subunit C-like [Homarus americanus]|uniref:Mycosubtilin synthase subunit C-like n=1 Tax=Homarus americanus TaxID=6706 RepID=A0A8J5MM53_HOMAM|nr:Mycosubtilin synthase subunit C-like [Homarus americanus]
MVLKGKARQLPEVVVMPRLFECVVLGRPASPALKDAHQHDWISYQELNDTANTIARLQSSTRANPDGDRVVAVCMAPSSHLVTTLLAIHKAGAAYLPLDITFPESRMAHILNDARPTLLLASGHPQALQSIHTNPQVENNVPILHLEDLQAEMEEERHDDLTAEEVGMTFSESSIATILYTSGSTGIPKGVRISHKAVLNRLAWQWSTFPYQEDEVCCFKTALTFVDSISEIFGPLLTGHRVVVIPKAMTQAVDELVTVLDKEKVGRLVLVPSLLRSIVLHCSADDSPKLTSLRLWVCSGEVFPSDLLHSFFKTFTKSQTICNFYGSTEVMGDVTYLHFHDHNDAMTKLVNNKVPVGIPITNCQIYLLNSDGELVTEGQMGEVYASGLNLASGYVGRAQPEKFVTNKHTSDTDYSVLYRTGDFGKVINGMLVFEGRADSQIKIRGHRVDMNEVELAMLMVKGVDKALVAFYTSHDDKLVPEVLKVQISTLLQPYMQPQLIHMDDLPLLVNGKVDRQQLLKVYEQRAKGDEQEVDIDLTGVSSQQEAAARALLLTVGHVLGPAVARGKKLSLNTSFFEVGGNSLNSVLTVTSLKDLGYNVGIGQFMKAKTLGEVVLNMQKVSSQEEGPSAPGGMISESFAEKGDLEQHLHTEPWEYIKLLNPIFDELVEQDLSFVIMKPETEEVVACAFNLDLWDEPPFEDLSPKLDYVLTFLEYCEEPANFMMGTLLQLGPAENVELIEIMEYENLKVAARNGYKAVFTTNTSSLTQQVCDDFLNYKVLNDQQVNLWVAPDGTKPFGLAPDSQHAVTTVKFL